MMFLTSTLSGDGSPQKGDKESAVARGPTHRRAEAFLVFSTSTFLLQYNAV